MPDSSSDVDGGVPMSVGQTQLSASPQQQLHHVGLVSQHCQVQGRLQGQGSPGQQCEEHF